MKAKRKDYRAPHTPHEQRIIANATSYSAYLFISRNKVFTMHYEKQEEAQTAAQRLADTYKKPAIVYAICGGSQAYLRSVQPQ